MKIFTVKGLGWENNVSIDDSVFEKYEVQVFRPEIIENYNQIFSRDIGFVIDDIFVKANILPDRERELDAIQYVLDQIDPNKIVRPPEEVHIEGGDVMVWNDYIFIGTYKGSDYKDYITARTNMHGVNYIKDLFPHKIVKEFDLEVVNTDFRIDCKLIFAVPKSKANTVMDTFKKSHKFSIKYIKTI